jgi:hypothetical protein
VRHPFQNFSFPLGAQAGFAKVIASIHGIGSPLQSL